MKILLLFLMTIITPPHHKLYKMWFYIPEVEMAVPPPSYIYDQNCESAAGHKVFVFDRSDSQEFRRCVVVI